MFFFLMHNNSNLKSYFSRESKHIKVCKTGDQLPNGNGNLFVANIINDNSNKCEALMKFHFFEIQLLYFAQTKNNDRFS